MKNNFKKVMMVAAFSVIGLGAFATTIANLPKANETVYNWIRTGGEQLPNEVDPFEGTKSQAEDNFGCRGTTEECAVGISQTPGLPNAVLYQN